MSVFRSEIVCGGRVAKTEIFCEAVVLESREECDAERRWMLARASWGTLAYSLIPIFTIEIPIKSMEKSGAGCGPSRGRSWICARIIILWNLQAGFTAECAEVSGTERALRVI
jgi:hypothetical protein